MQALGFSFFYLKGFSNCNNQVFVMDIDCFLLFLALNFIRIP